MRPPSAWLAATSRSRAAIRIWESTSSSRSRAFSRAGTNPPPHGRKEKQAMSSDAMIGTIALFAGNFAPRGWQLCQGQILSIAQNTALFSILGTTYGGNGQTTFALPDLRGRSPISAGTGPGLRGVQLAHAA